MTAASVEIRAAQIKPALRTLHLAPTILQLRRAVRTILSRIAGLRARALTRSRKNSAGACPERSRKVSPAVRRAPSPTALAHLHRPCLIFRREPDHPSQPPAHAARSLTASGLPLQQS